MGLTRGFTRLMVACLGLALAATASSSSVVLSASYDWSRIFESFESISPPALPAGWVTLNANSDAGVWETRDYSGVKWGRQCIRYVADPANPGPADDWFFTSGVYLAAGKQYTIEFRYCCSSSSSPEAMSVFVGTTQDPAGMILPLWGDLAITDTDYALASAGFTVTVSGNYYLGFHAESPPYMNRLYVDDVNLLEPQDGLEICLFMTKELLVEGVPTYSSGDSIECVVGIKNIGTSPIVIYRDLSLGAGATDTQLGFDITGPDGLPVPILCMYEKGGPATAAAFQVLYPDSTVGKVVDLWGWYEFGPIGQYTIRAHYKNYADPGGIGAWKGEMISDSTVVILE